MKHVQKHSMASMPVDPADREAYNVRLAIAWHHRTVIDGIRCRDCWFQPRNCMCSLAKEWLQVTTPTAQRPIQFLMLFHSREVGNLSSTGKLVVAGGLGTGFVNGWVHPSSAGMTPINVDPDQSATIGLTGDVGFATALEEAARRGPVAVLYPADDAVEVTSFYNLCRHRNGTTVNLDATTGIASTTCSDVLEQAKLEILASNSTATVAQLDVQPCDMLTVVVLDGTYRQARLLNRLPILSKFTRVRINPTCPSEFDSLRTQSKLREEVGRTSTIEAVAALLQAYEPNAWGTDGACEQWRQALRFMVDNVRLQRGLPSCYGLDNAVALNSGRER
jgi:DTW domain-containing protein YfiP